MAASPGYIIIQHSGRQNEQCDVKPPNEQLMRLNSPDSGALEHRRISIQTFFFQTISPAGLGVELLHLPASVVLGDYTTAGSHDVLLSLTGPCVKVL